MGVSTAATHQSPIEDCQRKRRYTSKASAKRVAKRHQRPTNVYLCPHCGSWHISSRRNSS